MKNLIKILILSMCLMLIAGCAKVAQTEEKTGDAIDFEPGIPIKVKMTMDGTPSLNNEVTINAKVRVKQNLDDVAVKFHLPEGFEFISGDSEWEGSMNKKDVVSLTIKVKAIKTGHQVIEVTARETHASGFGESGDYFYIDVGEDSADYSHYKPIPKQPPMEYSVGRSESSLDFVMTFNEPPVLNKNVELSLMIKQYLDRKSNLNTSITLPDNFRLVSGDLDWNGELAPGQVVYNKIIIKAVKEGEGAIRVVAGPVYPQGLFRGMKLIYFNISKDSAETIRLWHRLE